MIYEILGEAAFSFNDRREILATAINAQYGPSGDQISGPWIREIWDTELVFEDNESKKFFMVPYTLRDDGTVLLGDPTEVRMKTTYEVVNPVMAPTTNSPGQVAVNQVAAAAQAAAAVAAAASATSESGDVELPAEYIQLLEAASKGGDTVAIKIIQPGWGSSGHYSKEVLERDAKEYIPGTQMFWDHPTLNEEDNRPERSLRDLAGVLMSGGRWDAEGPDGPGIYADAKVMDAFRPTLENLAPYIGVSHRALGKVSQGEAEGRTGYIVEKISAVQSVDFVTAPGAGGKILELFEAARTQNNPKPKKEETDEMLTEAQIKELQERAEKGDAALKENESLKEANTVLGKDNETLKEKTDRHAEAAIVSEAKKLVEKSMEDKPFIDATKNRLVEKLTKNPAVTEDKKLDVEALTTATESAVKEETEYLSQVTEAGVIKGLGDNKPKVKTEAGESSALVAAFEESFSDVADPVERKRQAEIAAQGR